MYWFRPCQLRNKRLITVSWIKTEGKCIFSLSTTYCSNKVVSVNQSCDNSFQGNSMIEIHLSLFFHTTRQKEPGRQEYNCSNLNWNGNYFRAGFLEVLVVLFQNSDFLPCEKVSLKVIKPNYQLQTWHQRFCQLWWMTKVMNECVPLSRKWCICLPKQ